MFLGFLLSLGVCALASYIYKRSLSSTYKHSGNEISMLAAAVALVSLLLGLIMAPWQLQLLIVLLLVVVGLSQSFSPQLAVVPGENITTPAEDIAPQPEPPPVIRHCYRGQSYQPPSTKVDLDEKAEVGQYRGATFKFYTVKQAQSAETQE